MRLTGVKVPARLLLDRRLPSTARFLWLVLQLCAPDERAPRRLHERSGLARHTVRRALAALDLAGWLSGNPDPRDGDPVGHASFPPDLLLAKEVGVPAKLIYGALQLLPGFHHQSVQFTLAALGELTGLTPVPVREAVRQLEHHCWLQLVQRTKFSPIDCRLRNPVVERRVDEVTLVDLRLREAKYRGEAIMQEFLSMLVDSDEFEENARPGFLINPYTGERMEFDRYYPPRVAFEFNGDQHFGPTQWFPSEVKAWKQQGRDYIKLAICAQRGITLVTVTGDELSMEALTAKIDGLLPLRNLVGKELLIDLLEEAGSAYRRERQRQIGKSSRN